MTSVISQIVEPAYEHSVQDLSVFHQPRDFRGRSAAVVQLWWLVQALLFRTSPQFMFGWRRFLLRAFGANIGRGVKLRPSVRTTYPWKLEIGKHSWIGDHVELYSLGPIKIGANVCVSQGSYLCTGSHDRHDRSFPIYAQPITIDDEAWLASQVFVMPGVHIGRGAFVGVRSLVLKDVPPGVSAVGHPAKIIGPR